MKAKIQNQTWYYALYRPGLSSPLVLLHGSGADHTVWGYTARALRHHTVVAVDLPGHSRSTGPALNNIDVLADRVADFIHTCFSEPVSFVGHSMGGAVVLSLALRYPSMISAAVVVGSGARLRVHPDLLEHLINGRKDDAIAWLTRYLFASSVAPYLVERLAYLLHKCSLRTLYSDFLACNRFDIMDSLDRIHKDVLVIGMEQDRMTPLKYTEYLTQHIPGAIKRIIPDAGHAVMLERPVELAQIIENWLNDRISI